MGGLHGSIVGGAGGGGGGISEVSEDTSPTLGGDLDVGANKILASGSNDLVFKLPDNAGARKLSIQDSDNVEVAYINSNGIIGATDLSAGSSGLMLSANNNKRLYIDNNAVRVASAGRIGFSSSANPSSAYDSGFMKAAAGIIGVRGSSTSVGGSMEFLEQTAPSGATDVARIYAEDNGSGKTRLMVIFQTGAAQQVAIEP